MKELSQLKRQNGLLSEMIEAAKIQIYLNSFNYKNSISLLREHSYTAEIAKSVDFFEIGQMLKLA